MAHTSDKQSMNRPEISVVLPTYNGERFLRRALDSILDQTFERWELIIVNDASTDSTQEIINNYQSKDPRIRCVRNARNEKLPASLNIGFSHASGGFLTWTSDDNYYDPEAFAKMLGVLESNRDIGLVYADMAIVSEDEKIIRSKARNYIGKLYSGCCVGACFMYRADLHDRFGTYDTSLFCAEDYEFWLRLWTGGVRFHHLKKMLYYYRDNPASLSATKASQVLKKTFDVKVVYWDRAPVSAFAKCLSLCKTQRKAKCPLMLEKIYSLHPIMGRVIKFIKK